jgi:hypothetical protein
MFSETLASYNPQKVSGYRVWRRLSFCLIRRMVSSHRNTFCWMNSSFPGHIKILHGWDAPEDNWPQIKWWKANITLSRIPCRCTGDKDTSVRSQVFVTLTQKMSIQLQAPAITGMVVKKIILKSRSGVETRPSSSKPVTVLTKLAWLSTSIHLFRLLDNKINIKRHFHLFGSL